MVSKRSLELRALLTLFSINAIMGKSRGVLNVNESAISKELRVGFYDSTCPGAELIVSKVIRDFSQRDRGIIPGLIRLHFHDCFISGCDASVFLVPSKVNNFSTEQVVPANLSLRGIKALSKAKTKIEKQCPGVVSCADIIAFAARDAVALAGNQRYLVPAGRRDALSSTAYRARNLPSPIESITSLAVKFAKRGLSLEDMVVLEGSHSIGQAHCILTTGDSNVTELVRGFVDKKFQSMVMANYCKGEKPIFLEISPLNPNKGDTDWGVSFYQNALKGEGLFLSDLKLVKDPRAKEMVHRLSSNQTLWKFMFNDAMIKMGKMNVLTGNQGEIRKRCAFTNLDNQHITNDKKVRSPSF